MADKGTPAANPISELKVSGHSMQLEPGLYCVFNAPDSPAPSGHTGLPGVRISSAPGVQGGRVEIAGFESNGWIGADAAALIRVSDAAASVVVTVYQEPDSKGEAPKLQVVTLSGQAARAPVPQAARAEGPQPPQAPQAIEVMAHVYGRGDVGGALSSWIGEPGSNRWIEGFAVAPQGVPASDIEYQAVLGRGWLSPWAEGGQFCGSRGMSLPILGLRVKLRGDSARTHQIQLMASFIDGTRIGPVHDGAACEAPSLAALEAFQLVILPMQAAAAAETPRRAVVKAPPAALAKVKQAKPAPQPVEVQAPPRRKQAVKPPVPAPAPVPVRGKAKAKAPAAPTPVRAAPAKRAPTTRRR